MKINFKSGLSMLIIAIVVGGLAIALGLLAYFFLYQPTQTANETPMPITTLTESQKVDNLDTELQNMQTDDTSEELNQTDYQGL